MALGDKVIITCAVTGAVTTKKQCAAIPYNAVEIGEECRRAYEAGKWDTSDPWSAIEEAVRRGWEQADAAALSPELVVGPGEARRSGSAR